MKSHTYTLLLFLFFTEVIHSEKFLFPVGAKALSLGTSSVSSSDIFAIANNPAASIPYYSNNKSSFIVGIDYQQKYSIIEYSIQSAFLSYYFNSGAISLIIQKHGFSEYNEQRSGISFARGFGPKISFSLQLDYLQLQRQHLKNLQNFSFETGFLYSPVNKINIGFQLFNPLGIQLKSNNTKINIPSIARFGISYNLERIITLSSEIESVGGKNNQIKFGIEYILNNFSIRSGLFNDPLSYTGGIGIKRRNFEIDAAIIHHPQLSFSASLSIVFIFQNNNT